MKTFIDEIVNKIWSENGDHLEDLCIVFPNRRAGLYFQKALSKRISKPIWMPRILSFEDYILSLSPLNKLESFEAIFRLYEIYKKHHNWEEPFDKFFFWGEMIIKDFEEIDHYLADPKNIFTSIQNQKELDEAFYFLDEEQRAIIESFWANFLPETTKTQEAFLSTWKILLPIYEEYTRQLVNVGLGYLGLIYRRFVEGLEENQLEIPYKLIFAGFNALTKSEEKIIKYFVSEHKAKIFWDIDQYYLLDKYQEAGHFLREYRKDHILGPTFPSDLPNGVNEPKEMKAIGVSLEVGQAKAMAEVLEDQTIDPEKTVVVLPAEHMLLPTLHSLPERITDLNVTMGFPLKDTQVFGLIESLILLQKSKRNDLVHGLSFYHKHVTEILSHPLVNITRSKENDDLVLKVRKRNLIFVYHEELPVLSPLLAKIFISAESGLEYLMDILKTLYDTWQDSDKEIELEFVSRFYQQIESMKSILGERGEVLSYDFLLKLFRRLVRSLKVPFAGEPLTGLQIMGILETRNLDFENVFILNMNEGSWPATRQKGSFIPYNIRKAFNMPVHEHQDAIYAYLFYRLLHRSKRVWFFYNTVSEFNVNGELSRFVKQLEYESQHQIVNKVLANPVTAVPNKPIVVEKNQEILEKLDRFVLNGANRLSRLSPSALDTYLHCRLKFYLRHVEELYEPEQLQEEMDPMVFGNILHDTMEILYAQFIKAQKKDVIEPNDFFWLEGGVDGAINKAFMQHYQLKNEKKFKLEGRNIIAADIIRKTAVRILKFDQQYAPFKILGLEASTRKGLKKDFSIQVNGEEKVIALGGRIDRIDVKQGVVRVIDYKTGRDEKNFTSVDSLIDREDKNRNKAALQVLYYSYLVEHIYGDQYDRIEPGIFNSRDLFNPEFNWRLLEKPAKSSGIEVKDFKTLENSFEEILTTLLTEIYDPNVSFDQVSDVKKCQYCPYSNICGRE